MQQVNRDKLVNVLEAGTPDRTTTLLKDFRHHDPERRLFARLIAVGLLADKLKRSEMVTDAPAQPDTARLSWVDAAIQPKPCR